MLKVITAVLAEIPTWGWFLIGWGVILVITAPLLGAKIATPDPEFDDDWP